MELMCGADQALRGRVMRGDDHVVVAQVERFDRRGIQRQQPPVASRGTGNAAEARLHHALLEGRGPALRRVEDREDGRIGKRARHDLDAAFRAAALDERIGDDRDAHLRPQRVE
jgi:hypothetical protein